MEKIFNNVSIIFGLIGGATLSLFGGWDKLLWAISLLVVIDYCTGILKALYLKKLSSAIGYNGLLKKVLIFIVIMLACILEQAFSDIIPLREMVIVFYIVNESISIIENISEILPIPEQITQFLIQIRNDKK